MIVTVVPSDGHRGAGTSSTRPERKQVVVPAPLFLQRCVWCEAIFEAWTPECPRCDGFDSE